MNTSTLKIAVISILTIAGAHGCASPEPDPLNDALVAKVMEINPSLNSFKVYSVALTDTVTLSDELDRRTALFRTKLSVENKLAAKYKSENKPKNMTRHLEAARKAESILAALDAYRAGHGASMDSTLYYVYSFRGFGETIDGAEVSDAPMRATVTPDLKVYNLHPEGKSNIYRGMGVAIPGYKALLESLRVSEEGEK